VDGEVKEGSLLRVCLGFHLSHARRTSGSIRVQLHGVKERGGGMRAARGRSEGDLGWGGGIGWAYRVPALAAVF